MAEKSLYGKKTSFMLLSALVFLAFLVSASYATTNVIYAGIDKNSYTPLETITLSGMAYSGTSVADGSATIQIINSSSEAVNTSSANVSSGAFSITFSAPPVGEYLMTISFGDTSIALNFSVSNIASIKMDLVNETIVVSSTGTLSAYGITADPKITGARKGANFTYGGTNYSMIIENSSTVFDTLYIDDDTELYFNNSGGAGKPMMKYLKVGSKVRFGLKDFEVWYISPNGSEVIFAERLRPVFSAGSSQWITILALALSNNGTPVSSAELLLKVMNETLSGEYTSFTTAQNGTVIVPYLIGSSMPAGNYYFVANDMAMVSFTLRGFDFTPSILDAEGNPVYLTSEGSQLTLKAAVLSNGDPVTSAVVTAIITSPSDAVTASLTGSGGTYSTTYTPAVDGDYAVEFRATYAGDSQTATLRFKVRTYDIFVMPVAGQKGPSDGFAPGKQGAAFVGARRMDTGDFANLSSLTSNCNETKVILKGIFDSTGADKLVGGALNTSNITYFLETNPDIPSYMWNEIKRYFGDEACVITFTAPNTTGVYEFKVNVSAANISGEASSTIGVQDIFVWAYPVSSDSGNYQWAVSPGGNVTLAINGYDSVNGQPLSSDSIIDANIVEVFAEEAGMVVTDQMVGEAFGNGKISFVANDSVMGHHSVKLRVKANITRDEGVNYVIVEALGQGWFQEKLFDVWVYPSGDKNYGMFGSGSTINMTVDVRDMGGSAKSDVVVTLDEVRYSETWETIPNILGPTGSSAQCTTQAAANGSRGGCTLSFSPSSSWNSGTWKSGGYSLKVKATYTDPTTNTEVTDYGYGWFEVRTFNFWAWSRDWEVTTNQNITISANVQSFNGTPITAAVSVDKILYMGTWENWQPPTVVNASVGVSNNNVSGEAPLVIPAGTLTKQGQYDIVLNATVSGIGTETAHAWVYTKPFTIYVDDPTQNWERRYETNGNVTLNITGFEKINWNTWPPTGTGHNISAAWVQRVEKVGKWGTDYKTKQQMITDNNMTSSCSGSNCLLTFNLSSFANGEYNLVIKANDSLGSEAENYFWMRVESMRITMPQLLDWVRVYDNRKMDNSTYFAIDDKCGGNDDTPQGDINNNNNVTRNLTDCKYKAVQIVKKLSSQSQNGDYNYTYFMLDRNTSNPKVYINNTDLDENPGSVAFNTSDALAKGEGDTFLDSANKQWRISRIDQSGNYLYLEAVQGVIGKDDWDTGSDPNTYLVKITQSLSKSGTFLKNFGDYGLYDQDWMNIDLNGNGEFWSDRYYIVMADSAVSGKYDNVFISNTNDFTNAINATNISNEIKFGGARGIKLLGYKFVGGANGGANYYKLTFTSNKAGWPGMDLGIYKPNSIVNVPVLVTSPRNESIGIANATVKIAKLIKFGMMGETEVSLPIQASDNTTSTGLAILQVNLANVSNGEYMLKLEVQKEGAADWTTTGSTWENPRISVRSFVVSGRLGLKGQIDNLVKWNESEGNMKVVMSDQQFGGLTEYMNYDSGYDVYRIGWWEYRKVYYNHSSDPPQIIIDTDDDWNPTTNNVVYNYTPGVTTILAQKWNNNTEFMRIDQITIGNEGYNTTVPFLQSVVARNYNFTVLNAVPGPNGNATIRIEKIGPWGSWPIVGGNAPRTFNVSEQVTPDWGWGYEGFNITDVINNTVIFTWVYPTITMNSTLDMQGTQKVGRVLNLSKIGASGEYELIIYNSPAKNTSDDLGNNPWSDAVDTARVINSSGIVNEYAFGVPIPEANNFAVVGARKWDDRVYLSNLTINSRAIYPMPWTCDDNNALYIANFTEKSAEVKMTENYGPQGGEANLSEAKQYYALLRDNDCNGAKSITQAIVDDDPIFDERSLQGGPQGWQSYDFDHVEEGAPRNQWDMQNRSEDYFDISMERWPFTATSFNESGRTLDLFSFRDWTEKGQNLFLWVSAKNFDGTAVNGNVIVKSIKGMQFSCNSPPTEVSLNVSSYTGTPLSGGAAYVRLNMTNMTGGQYTAKFNVTSEQGTYEILESNFWVNDMGMKESGACMGTTASGVGYGGY